MPCFSKSLTKKEKTRGTAFLSDRIRRTADLKIARLTGGRRETIKHADLLTFKDVLSRDRWKKTVRKKQEQRWPASKTGSGKRESYSNVLMDAEWRPPIQYNECNMSGRRAPGWRRFAVARVVQFDYQCDQSTAAYTTSDRGKFKNLYWPSGGQRWLIISNLRRQSFIMTRLWNMS